MAGQIEEAHLMGGLAQTFPQLASGVSQIDFGQHGDRVHSCHLPIIAAGKQLCHRPDQQEPN
jgi:hypothetical protein